MSRHSSPLSPFILILCLLACALPRHALALASPWQRDDAVAVRLVSGVDGVGADKDVPLGLDVEMQPNWHTYWRSPGMAGLPPQIDWHIDASDEGATKKDGDAAADKLSGNLQAVDLHYPAPKRYTAYGLETIGYREHVLFPVTAHLVKAGEALSVYATVNLLVCSDTCVPKSYDLRLTVPKGDAKPSAEAALIKQYNDQVPAVAGSDSGAQRTFGISSVSVAGNNVTFTLSSATPLDQPDAFVEDDKDIGFGAPQVTLSPDKMSATLSVSPTDALPDGAQLGGMPLTVTVTDGSRSIEQHVTVPGNGASSSDAGSQAAATLQTPALTPLPLGMALIFALIGGFILNLMPCVLPVLSLKLLSAIRHGGHHTRQVRYSFLATAAGILFSFLVLAGVTILLKTFGMTVGWGVQFQQPAFLTALILIVTLFAANMWGVFEVALPRLIADKVGSGTGKPSAKLTGDFITGAFATLLATPCTAPFLGTAVGFALASGPRDIVMIFATLGVGMILPYLAVALFPSIATALPKPGAWMVTLRHGLGVILALTAGWLLWVLAAQVTPQTAFEVGICMAAIVLLLALRKTTGWRYARSSSLFLAAVAFGFALTGSPTDKMADMPDSLWTPFDQSAIAADIADGKTVFVDVTADWCLTCKANKRFILSEPEVEQKLFHDSIVAMQADWTNPDPAIAAYLQKYGRYGIPFNIVYGPGAPEGIVLPELLSTASVMDAFAKAAGATAH